MNLSDAASLWGARAGGNDRGSKHLSHIPNLPQAGRTGEGCDRRISMVRSDGMICVAGVIRASLNERWRYDRPQAGPGITVVVVPTADQNAM